MKRIQDYFKTIEMDNGQTLWKAVKLRANLFNFCENRCKKINEETIYHPIYRVKRRVENFTSFFATIVNPIVNAIQNASTKVELKTKW